jgi:L-alanine-DL-glutamate epimerase-like enolase superfamily enzyme/D-alanine-D-alanine ligase-like ATP-grasp enzyme
MNKSTRIIGTEAFRCTVPLKNPFSTSRYTSTKSTNYLIRLSTGEQVGIGEAAARSIHLTGDHHKRNGQVLEGLLEVLRGQPLDLTDREAALRSIEMIYLELEAVAGSFAVERNRRKPFRGLLSGFDVALLDLAAKSLGITVAQLLGEVRKSVRATATTCSTAKEGGELQLRLLKHALRYDAYRCKGAAELEENMRRLGAMRTANFTLRKARSYWLDLNEALSREDAFRFVDRVVDWLQESPAPGQELILEQPVKKRQHRTLCELQHYADERLAEGAGRIVIMADECLWDGRDFKRLQAAGGCGAVNIKVPKVGGLRPALALARKVHEEAPETRIYIGGMIGTSDISGRAIYHLVKALPRVDHCTTSPARNVQANLAGNPLRFRSKTSSEILLGEGAGLGTDIDYEVLEAYCTASYPARPPMSPPAREHAGAPNVYSAPELLGFNQKELDSHLLEKEALLHGLTTVRRDGLRFVAMDSEGCKVSFYWTLARGLSAAARQACRRKYEAKELFSKAAVPVAEGRRFKTEQLEEAAAYARDLGWPVVVKPGVGTGGVGVTANIRSEDELQWALDKIVSNKKVGERNDGNLLVERHIGGTELRLFVADGRAVGAIERIQPHVIGDGVNTVKTLVAQKNALRGLNPRLSNSLLKLNGTAQFELRRQGLTRDSVPEAGRFVTLSPVRSISQGADMRSVLEEVHPSILQAAVRAAKAIPGLKRGGLDFIVADHTRLLSDQEACVCEMNTSPSIAAAHYPMYGKPVNVARALYCCAASRKRLQPGQRTSAERLAVNLLVSASFTRSELMETKAYFSQHQLEGGAVASQGGTILYASGRQGVVCALSSAMAVLMGRRHKPVSIESLLVTPEPEWLEKRFPGVAPLFSSAAPALAAAPSVEQPAGLVAATPPGTSLTGMYRRLSSLLRLPCRPD